MLEEAFKLPLPSNYPVPEFGELDQMVLRSVHTEYGSYKDYKKEEPWSPILDLVVPSVIPLTLISAFCPWAEKAGGNFGGRPVYEA